MVTLTKIDGMQIIVNAEEIETIESSFESTVCLKSGKKIIVKESADLIISMVVNYKKQIIQLADNGGQ